MLNSASLSIAIIADIIFDYWIESKEVLNLPMESYERRVGGNLVHLTLAAAQLFDKVFPLGSVNKNDIPTIKYLFKSEKIIPFIRGSALNTGVCVIITDNGSRKNLISFKNANTDISINEGEFTQLSHVNFLFVTGWVFFPDNSITVSTCLQLSEAAAANGNVIVFDMLPHTINHNTITEAYKKQIHLTDILVVEKNTFNRIFNSVSERDKYAELGKIKFILMYDMKQEQGTCNKVTVYNMLTQTEEEITIAYNSKSSEKTYLDYTALKIILERCSLQSKKD